MAGDDDITTTEDTAVTITPAGNDSDAEGDTLSVTAVTEPSNGSAALDTTTNIVTYTPAANYHGPDSFTYTVSDGNGGTATGTVNLTVSSVEDFPDLSMYNPYNISTTEDTPVSINLPLNDTDADGDTLILAVNTPPSNGSATLADDGRTIIYTPKAHYNSNDNGTDTPDSFTYTVSDGKTTFTGTVNITVSSVNDAPVAVDDNITTKEDESVTINITDQVLNNDTDVEEDDLTVTNVTSGNNGTTELKAGDGTIIYTPAADYHGTDSFTYTISDGNGGTATGTINITVSSVNDAGPVTTDDNITTTQDTPVSINIATEVLNNDTDEDGDTLTVTNVTSGNNGTASLSEDGSTIIYTPSANYYGPDSFTYTVSDGNGGEATGTVNVKVLSVPVAGDDNITTTEDTAVSINVETDVLSNDTDADGDDLSVTEVSQPSNGTVELADDGSTITYTPNDNYYGDDSFTYTVSDGTNTNTGTVNLTVSAVNDDKPVAVDDTITTPEDVPVSITPASNDTDADEQDDLSVTEVSQPSNGSAVLDTSTSIITYTPAANYHGPDSFTYTVSDGTDKTDTGTVNITVSSVNDAGPVAVDDTITTLEDTPVSITPASNDTDEDLDPLSVTVNTPPSNGSVILESDGMTIIYTPNGDYHGTDSFTYTVSDGTEIDTGTVNITVSSVNDDPVALEDNITT
ncbi:MAG: tandem-95 repeat protein, partial [Aphanocapsa feldmannii 277cV]